MLGFSRITPWVGRLIIANAMVLLLLQTLLTAPAVTAALAFNPSSPFVQPWTYFTYAFVHADLWHLLFNMLGLYVFGSVVEERLGSNTFIALWCFAAIGAALVTAVINPLFAIGPFVGASGAVMALSVVFAMMQPDAELMVFPIPIPIKAKTLVLLLVGYNALMAILPSRGGVAYEAHLAGALMGFLFVRASAWRGRDLAGPSFSPVERSWAPSGAGSTRSGGTDGGIIPSGTQTSANRGPSLRSRPPEPRVDPESVEIDRVLDKISATGIASLSPEERRFLDDVSNRRKQGNTPN